jgi:hypothetical protein
MNYTVEKYKRLIFKGQSVRDWMKWGTYGKNGDQPLKLVLLKDMSDEHIRAILKTQFHINKFYRNAFKRELTKRLKNPKYSIVD